MNIKCIQDQIENVAEAIALDAYQLGMEHSSKLWKDNEPLPNIDDLRDQINDIIKEKLEG